MSWIKHIILIQFPQCTNEENQRKYFQQEIYGTFL